VATIKTNIENIYCKFDVHNKVELVIYLIKNKIVEI
jgi:DNA-binding NarL/FixJ family response regulator